MAAAAAGTIPSLQVNRNLNYVFTSIDPTSLILSQFSHTFHQAPYDLQLSSQSYYMERGSRYQEYAALREYKLRMKKNIIIKQQQQQQQEDDFNLLGSSSVSQLKQIKSPAGYLITPPPISTTKRQSSLSSKGYSADYGPVTAAAASKKENGNGRAAMVAASGLKSKSGTYDGILGKMVGRKKSYASLEALKGLGSQARRAINGESKGMRTPKRNCNLDKTEFAYSSQF